MTITNDSSFGARLKFFMDKKEYNSIDMAGLVGKSSANIRHWCNGVRFPRSDDLPMIADVLGVTILDLFHGAYRNRERIVKEEINKKLPDYIGELKSLPLPSSIKKVPIVKGYPTSSTNNIVQDKRVNYVNSIYIDTTSLKEEYRDHDIKAVKMEGDSMSPYLEDGETAIFSPALLSKVDGIYAIITDYGIDIKRLSFLRDGCIRVIAENQNYNTQGTYADEYKKEEADTLEILGKIIGRFKTS